jgi:hypothetical protein
MPKRPSRNWTSTFLQPGFWLATDSMHAGAFRPPLRMRHIGTPASVQNNSGGTPSMRISTLDDIPRRFHPVSPVGSD